MTSDLFIFSNRPGPRVSRHLVFWCVFILYLFLFRFYLKDLQEVFHLNTYVARSKSILLFLPLSVGYAYFSLYYLLPEFILKGRYLRLLLIVFLLALILLLLSHLISPAVDIRTVWDVPSRRDAFLREMDFAFHNVLVMPLTVSGFAIGIKMTKDWYLKQKETESLEKQKLKTVIQLQKTQLHPRFLFHSLNIIYANLMNGSQQSAPMLLKLSYILSYLLYETEEERVLLGKELNIARDYVDLAQAGYGAYFHVHMDNLPKTGNKMIAPLILLPLLEFIFTRDKTDDPATLWIEIFLEANVFTFTIRLQDSADSLHQLLKQKDIFAPVQQRLENQYPGRYTLDIERKYEMFILSLQVHLETELVPGSRFETTVL